MLNELFARFDRLAHVSVALPTPQPPPSLPTSQSDLATPTTAATVGAGANQIGDEASLEGACRVNAVGGVDGVGFLHLLGGPCH